MVSHIVVMCMLVDELINKVTLAWTSVPIHHRAAQITHQIVPGISRNVCFVKPLDTLISLETTGVASVTHVGVALLDIFAHSPYINL
jgi:hypothetical protein